MLLKKLNQLFPFPRLIKLLLLFAIILQTIIISYNHFSGYYNVPDFANFMKRLLFSSLFTLIAGLLIAYLNLFIIHLLNISFAWNKYAIKRIALQVLLTLLLAVLTSTIVTLTVNWIDEYIEELYSVLLSNALIFSVVNVILMIVLEASIFFNESKEAKGKAESLEKQLSQIKFEVLKNQINPHFMFNSLNVLSGLIDNDSAKAQEFINEFSMIYRYVLETIEKPLVTLSEELGFVRSYFFLQEIRYGSNLTLEVNIPAELLKFYLPPLSLQIVLENAIKHNAISTSKPLKIEIFYDKTWVSVRNNIQARISSVYSSGLGQKNMIKRYAMISDKVPEFIVEANHYLVKLPLIENE